MLFITKNPLELKGALRKTDNGRDSVKGTSREIIKKYPTLRFFPGKTVDFD